MSNYEKVYAEFQRRFLELDHERAAQKLELDIDEEYIHINFFHRPFKVNRHTAQVTCPIYKGEIPFSERLLILHHMYYYKQDAVNSGRMVSFREITECANYEPAYRRNTLDPFAKYFSGKTELLIESADELNAGTINYGDFGLTLYAFPQMPLNYIFWDGDDEYPASANILFDRNIVEFIHPESVTAIADVGAKLLMGNDVYLKS